MRLLSAAICLLAISLSTPARAVGFICPPAPVTYLSANMLGDVYVNVGYGRIKICNAKTDSMGSNAETCRMWYSTLLTAFSTHQPVSLSFDTSNPDNASLTPGVCTEANFGNYATRPTYYLYVGT